MAESKQAPEREKDRQWCIVFISAKGRRKPDGIKSLVAGQFIPNFVDAPDRATALAKLRKETNLDYLDYHLGEARVEMEIRICDFDPRRREVIAFDSSGLDAKSTHFYAAIWEQDPKKSNSLPSREGARANRREMHAPLGEQYREGLRDKWGDPSELCPELQRKIKIGRKGCWIWTGAHNDGGYGVLTELGKRYLAHRVIFEVLRDSIREGAILMHSCNVRCCCNPGHLTPGSPLENRLDQPGRRPFKEMPYADVPAKEAKKIRLLYYAEKWTAKRIAEEIGRSAEDVRLVVRYRTGTDKERRAFENGYYRKL